MGSNVEAVRFPANEEHPSAAPSEAKAQRLRTIIDTHVEFVWRLVRRLGVAAADADDATQSVFWVVARRLDEIAPQSERAFVCATAMRVASDFRRARTRNAQQECIDDDLVVSCVDGTVDIEALVDQKKARAMLDRALDTLPIELRTVLVLAEGEQMTMSEIGELLSLPRGTVVSRLRRARAAFQTRVQAMAHPKPRRKEP